MIRYVGFGILAFAIVFGGRLIFFAFQSKKRPSDLGLVNGELRLCGDKPNCVCSLNRDDGHKVEPIVLSTSESKKLWASIQQTLGTEKNVKLVSNTEDYLHFEYTTPLMGFVDDVELHRSNEQPMVIQIRSASRVGYSDLGANKKRIEKIRRKINDLEK